MLKTCGKIDMSFLGLAVSEMLGYCKGVVSKNKDCFYIYWSWRCVAIYYIILFRYMVSTMVFLLGWFPLFGWLGVLEQGQIVYSVDSLSLSSTKMLGFRWACPFSVYLTHSLIESSDWRLPYKNSFHSRRCKTVLLLSDYRLCVKSHWSGSHKLEWL